jgi:hypothetical protein
VHIAGLSSLVSQHKYPLDQGFSNRIAGVALNEINILYGYYLNNKAGIWLAESGDDLYNAAYWQVYVA